jgi:hypothetical protein
MRRRSESTEPNPFLLWAQVAQLVEHCTENAGVGGSIPPLGTITHFLGCGSVFFPANSTSQVTNSAMSLGGNLGVFTPSA